MTMISDQTLVYTGETRMTFTTVQRNDAYNAVKDTLVEIVHQRAGFLVDEVMDKVTTADILKLSDAALNSLLSTPEIMLTNRT